jgi:Cof subfamily protein (haloacid dehalogenase superfamily)
VDGTLLNSRHELTPAVCLAVGEAARRGVQVVLTSARGPAGLRPIQQALGIWGTCVAFSGALRCRTSPGRPAAPMGGERMELDDARAAAQLGRELGVSIGWWDTEEWFVEAMDGPVTNEAEVIGVEPAVVDLSRLALAPFKLQCMAAMDQVDRLQALRMACPTSLAAAFSNPNYLELVRSGTDKGRGLVALGAQIGIAPGEMAAIGDGENDVGMLASVGLGVAMANAGPGVRAAAAWVTGSNDENGVAMAIERMRREGRI